MKVTITLHRSTQRGLTKFKWLESFHSFSFGHYVNTQRTGFGTLAVFNDDIIAQKKGFSTHPHDNMEIITIVTEGTIEHKDSMGSSSMISKDEIQVMTAGTGITHSETNPSSNKPVHLFQIWIEPREYGLKPRYQQKIFDQKLFKNKLYPVVLGRTDKDTLWIHQDAILHRGDLEKGITLQYKLLKNRGLFIFNIDGEIQVNNTKIEARDSLEIKDISEITFTAITPAKLIIIDIPF